MRFRSASSSISFALCALWLLAVARPALATDPSQTKQDAITVLNAHQRTVNLGGLDRTGYDPYAFLFDGELKIQTEATAMALYFAGVENLGLTAGQLQEIYDFYAYMMDVDGWLYSDYTVLASREFKKGLHNAWALIAIDILEQNGITDTAGLKAQVRDTLEAAIDSNGYMALDPDGGTGNLRTKFVQSLPFFFKIAQDTSDAGAIAKARLAVDFYMANCIDANFEIWEIDATGTKMAIINSHEATEFAHGLYLFHEYETDTTRKTAIQANLTGILNRYESGTWSFANSFSEKYLSNLAVSANVNTLSTFQIQFLLEFAGRKGWVTTGLAGAYLDIVDTIKITGTSDPELDNNFYYQADPDTGAQISANINSYNPSYVIHAIDTQYNTISGTLLDGGTPVADAVVAADGGGGSDVTDGAGQYAILVPHDWSGTITPTKPEYSFTPSNRGYANVTSDDPDEDYTGSYTADLTAPSPDPMTWAAVPIATSSTSISMTATTATDAASPPVEYFFECTSDPSASSGWQASPTYEATGLTSSTLYTFNVNARDSAIALNENAASSSESATTEAPPATATYDFTGISSPSATHKAEDGEIDASDSMIETGTFPGRRDFGTGWAQWGEANSGEYGVIVGSDDSRYQGADPGAGDNAAMLFSFYVNENPLDVVQVDVSLELGRASASDFGWVYIWNYATSSYLVLGSQSGTSDQVVAATVSTNAGDYIESGTGEVTILAVNEDTSDWIRVDDLSVTTHSTSAVVCGNNVLETGEDCDDGNTANGDCCSATCSFESAATECRASAGVCDLAETCTGSSGTCPADGFESAATECRAAADICDVAETCTGSGASCPADGFESAATECRAAADICDVAETCTGSGASCPADGFESAATECRAAADICDVAETCTGSGASCPADGFESAATECRAAVGVCDVEETCSGTGPSCPADEVLDGVPCLDADVCNGAEQCVVGVCETDTPLDCDDLDACTADSCDAIDGCGHTQIEGCLPVVPTSSEWGLVLMVLFITAGGFLLLEVARHRTRA